MHRRIAAERLANQLITRPSHDALHTIVEWFGAIQAQDLRAAPWAVALRSSRDPTAAVIQRSLDAGRILRTHVLRPTWHFVAASDITWMLELTGPHVLRSLASAFRNLGIDHDMRLRAARIIEQAVGAGGHLTRSELAAHLARAKIVAKGVPLAFLTIYAEVERIICSGERRGGQITYALLSNRAAKSPSRSRDDALGELAHRFLRSHGPATIRDFTWWSGLKVSDAKRGFEISRATSSAIDGLIYWRVESAVPPRRRSPHVHLLPIYDEYLVAYRDLDAVPRGKGIGGVLPQALVIDGEVVGTWKATRAQRTTGIDVTANRSLTTAERRALERVQKRYLHFVSSDQ